MIWALVRANWRLFAIGGLVLALLGGVVAFAAHERNVGRLAVEKADEAARVQAAAINAAALARATEQRATDQAATATLQKDLNRAYENTPDSRPAPARIALACGRLRAQHADVSKLAACAGPAPAR